MEYSSLWVLFGLIVLLAFTPGPGVFVIVARSMAGGFRSGVFTTAGIVSGDYVFIVISLLGMAALAETLGGMFLVVKVLAAGYLLWLGIQMILAKPEIDEIQKAESRSRWADFLAGFGVTMSNPKAIGFYAGIFPAYLDMDNLTVSRLVIVVGMITLLLTAAMLAYSFAASQTRLLIHNPRTLRIMNLLSGLLLIASAGLLVFRV